MTEILVPISPGELIDKLTILRIKTEQISDAPKLRNVRHELAELTKVADASIPPNDEIRRLWAALYDINSQLWVIEDDIRTCEARSEFGEEFVRLARAVYRTNDQRADLKKQINLALGSALVEEKSYVSPDGAGE